MHTDEKLFTAGRKKKRKRSTREIYTRDKRYLKLFIPQHRHGTYMYMWNMRKWVHRDTEKGEGDNEFPTLLELGFILVCSVFFFFLPALNNFSSYTPTYVPITKTVILLVTLG